MAGSEKAPPFTRHTIGQVLHAVGTARHAGGYRRTVCGRPVGSDLGTFPWEYVCTKCRKAVLAHQERAENGPKVRVCRPSNGKLTIHPNHLGQRQRPNTVAWKGTR